MRDPKRISSLTKTLPRHMEPERFANVAINAAIKNPALLDCSMATIYSSIIQAAELGLVPNTALNLCWLIPFDRNFKEGANWVKVKECQLIIGYAGYVDLMYRSGQVNAVSGFLVYKGDAFNVQYGTTRTIQHSPKFRTIKDQDIEFAYVVVESVRGGTPLFKVMSVEEIDEHRDFSKSGALGRTDYKGAPIEAKGPWVENYAAMCLKTPLRAIQPWVPKSAEMSKVLSLEKAQETGDWGALEFANELAFPSNAESETGGTSKTTASRVAKATQGTPKIDPGAQIPLTIELGMDENQRRDFESFCQGKDLDPVAVQEKARATGIDSTAGLFAYVNEQ